MDNNTIATTDEEKIKALTSSTYTGNNAASGGFLPPIINILQSDKQYDAFPDFKSEVEEIKDKASLLNIINAWRNYETRQAILVKAKEKKQKLKEEIHKLETLDEMKYRLLGLSEDEILNG